MDYFAELSHGCPNRTIRFWGNHHDSHTLLKRATLGKTPCLSGDHRLRRSVLDAKTDIRERRYDEFYNSSIGTQPNNIVKHHHDSLFWENRDLVRSLFVSASVWDSRNWNFSAKSLRSIAVFGGRLQRSSLCLIGSAPRHERGWGLSETSEKLLQCCILTRKYRAFGWILTPAERVILSKIDIISNR